MALWRAKDKPPVELVVANCWFKHRIYCVETGIWYLYIIKYRIMKSL